MAERRTEKGSIQWLKRHTAAAKKKMNKKNDGGGVRNREIVHDADP